MLLGPCLAAITAPAAAPDMMEFQGSSLPGGGEEEKRKGVKRNGGVEVNRKIVRNVETELTPDVGESAVKGGET